MVFTKNTYNWHLNKWEPTASTLGIYAALTECFPLKGVPLCMISQIGKSQNEENKDKFACYGHICNLRGCPHLEPGNQCLGTGTKWCCVHTVSTRYATAYIVTPFIPVRRHFLKNMSLATITKPWTATELKNGAHRGPVLTLVPQYKVSTL